MAYLNKFIYKDGTGLIGDLSLDLGRYNRYEEILLPNMTMTMLIYQLGIMDRVMYHKIPDIMQSTFRDLAGAQFNIEAIQAKLHDRQLFRYDELV